MPYVNNKGADQPAHARSLIIAFVVRCLDSIMPLLAQSVHFDFGEQGKKQFILQGK